MAANEVTKFIRNDTIQKRIEELLDKRAGQFTTSLITAVNANQRLASCKPETVLNAALTAASMDLPINQNLGFAALVPYGNECQFQMMWKGFVQLAQRSGHYKTINASDVREGEIKKRDRLSGDIEFDWKDDSIRLDLPVIGYVAYFRLTTGFEKTLYMSYDEIEKHGRKYSKNFKGVWTENFEAMALKTVIKLLISRFGPMNTELQTAIESDQAVIRDNETVYVDNDLDDVNATEDQKKAIIEANTVDDEPVDEVETVEQDQPSLPIEPELSVKEKAAKWAEEGKKKNQEKSGK